MMARWIDRTTFGLELQNAANSDQPERALDSLIRQIIIGDEVELCEDDATAVLTAAEAIEAALSDPERTRALARELGYLLVKPPGDRALDFIYIALDRDRLVNVVERHLNGMISRTGWLAFVSEQRWPERLRDAFKQLRRDALVELGDALRSRDWRDVQRLLFTSG